MMEAIDLTKQFGDELSNALNKAGIGHVEFELSENERDIIVLWGDQTRLHNSGVHKKALESGIRNAFFAAMFADHVKRALGEPA